MPGELASDETIENSKQKFEVNVNVTFGHSFQQYDRTFC